MTFPHMHCKLLERVKPSFGGGKLVPARPLFEEGIENLRAATEELAQADVRIQRLVERADGTFDAVDSRE